MPERRNATIADQLTCRLCPALCDTRMQVVLPTIPAARPYLLAIGEAPGADEDAAGEGFVGRAGKTLDTALSACGLTRGLNYGVANVVRCRPPNNRKPTAKELANCIPWLAETLVAQQPTVLFLVGATAASIFMGKDRLWDLVQASQKNAGDPTPYLDTMPASLAGAFRSMESAPRLIPSPHTSPLAWNRNAPDGQKWSEIGRAQAALAIRLLEKS